MSAVGIQRLDSANAARTIRVTTMIAAAIITAREIEGGGLLMGMRRVSSFDGPFPAVCIGESGFCGGRVVNAGFFSGVWAEESEVGRNSLAHFRQ